MLSLNKIMMTGRLVRDPELRYTAARVPVCDITLAHNRRFRGNDGSLRDEATFVDVTFWRKSAVKLVEFFQKGDPIYVEGRLAMDQWLSKDGSRKQKVKIAASEWRFVQPTHHGEDGQYDDGEYGDDDYIEEIVEEFIVDDDGENQKSSKKESSSDSDKDVQNRVQKKTENAGLAS